MCAVVEAHLQDPNTVGGAREGAGGEGVGATRRASDIGKEIGVAVRSGDGDELTVEGESTDVVLRERGLELVPVGIGRGRQTLHDRTGAGRDRLELGIDLVEQIGAYDECAHHAGGDEHDDDHHESGEETRAKTHQGSRIE